MNIAGWRDHAKRVLEHIACWERGPREDPSAIFSWFKNGHGPNSPRGSIKQMQIREGKVWFRTERKAGEMTDWTWLGDIERTKGIFKRLLDASASEVPINLNEPELRCHMCGQLGDNLCYGCRQEMRGAY